jgi:osmoprotectant transport system permease protein
MSAPVIDPLAGAVGTALPDSRPARGGLPTNLWLTPVLVGAAFLGTYWWVTRGDLQAVEAGFINREQLLEFTWDHLKISLISTALVLVTAIPLGVLLSRPGARAAAPVVGVAANVGQAATAFGLMVLFRVTLDVSATTAAILGMTIYTFLPVFRGTRIGMQQVDGNVVKAARGMGMSRNQVLFRIELPLSVPILLSGIRTALVLNVATTTVAALVGAGGLGLLIVRGFSVGRDSLIIVGAVATAGIAILADWVGAGIERLLSPKGLRQSSASNQKGNR